VHFCASLWLFSLRRSSLQELGVIFIQTPATNEETPSDKKTLGTYTCKEMTPSSPGVSPFECSSDVERDVFEHEPYRKRDAQCPAGGGQGLPME
jgi:hypothetical protein